MPSSVILGTARTPFGKMGGGLASLDATDLGGTVIEAALDRSGVAPEQVEQVVFGQVLQAGQGQIPSRQAQIKGGIPTEVSSETVNKVCASGIRAAGMVDQSIRAGDLQKMTLSTDLVHDLGVVDPLLLQSMYIFKQPGIGGEVTCHQDATFLYTEPPSVTGLWFALEDATQENGCLRALAGGHRRGLKSRFLRAEGGGTRFEVYDEGAWPTEGLVPLEVKKGALVVLHGQLPHLSRANRSPRSRQAYTLHVIEADARYPEDNWLRRGARMPLRGFE